ncbi:uncharacterized protein E0L32_003258 [Thyridium curvatum]|uniref:Uncharacterized protein n=1 Tax=Thyridium curvatum TaxID=1093900 RepID=A0A507BKC1_9PEZI|nr:uncharacterized protein E0L32_003258 [Thyridium curvatum]TPX17140.1 hypothetical protein E0L32_003258 [Thyridium curvatum]
MTSSDHSTKDVIDISDDSPGPSQASGAGPFPAPSTAQAAAEVLTINSAQPGNAGPSQGSSPPASNAAAEVVRALEGVHRGVTARLDRTNLAQPIEENTRDIQELRRKNDANLQGITEVGQTLASHAQMLRDVQAGMENLYGGSPLSAQPPSPEPEPEPEPERCIITFWVSPEMRAKIRGFEDF